MTGNINKYILKTEKSGMALVEVLFSVGVIAICMVALIAALVRSSRDAKFSRDTVKANQLAHEALEQARIYRDTNSWNAFLGLEGCRELDSTNTFRSSGCTWPNPSDDCSNPSYQIDSVFYRCVRFEGEDRGGDGFDDRMYIIARVFWQDGNRTHKAQAETLLTKFIK
jgi:type II secretory pathway pseudopilin PulG